MTGPLAASTDEPWRPVLQHLAGRLVGQLGPVPIVVRPQPVRYSFKPAGRLVAHEDERRLREWIAGVPPDWSIAMSGLYVDPEFGLCGPHEPNTDGPPRFAVDEYRARLDPEDDRYVYVTDVVGDPAGPFYMVSTSRVRRR